MPMRRHSVHGVDKEVCKVPYVMSPEPIPSHLFVLFSGNQLHLDGTRLVGSCHIRLRSVGIVACLNPFFGEIARFSKERNKNI